MAGKQELRLSLVDLGVFVFPEDKVRNRKKWIQCAQFIDSNCISLFRK